MNPKVFGFAGYSGAGKTTLIEQLIPRFVAAGLRVSLIKHAHHAFDVDTPGKDSYRHRQAGCTEVMVACDRRWVLMHELRDEPEPELEAQVARFSPCDLVLVEGFKRSSMPKLEIFRASVGKPALHPEDPTIVAVASDGPVATTLPVLDLGAPGVIAEFIIRHLALPQR